MSLEGNDRTIIASLKKYFDKLSIIGNKASFMPIVLFNVVNDMLNYCVKNYNTGNKGYTERIKSLNILIEKLKRYCPDICVYKDKFTKEKIKPIINAGPDKYYYSSDNYDGRGDHESRYSFSFNLEGSIIDPDNTVKSYEWSYRNLHDSDYIQSSVSMNSRDLHTTVEIGQSEYNTGEYLFTLRATTEDNIVYKEKVIITLCNPIGMEIRYLDESGSYINIVNNNIKMIMPGTLTLRLLIDTDNCGLIERVEWYNLRDSNVIFSNPNDKITEIEISDSFLSRFFIAVTCYDSDDNVIISDNLMISRLYPENLSPIVDAGDNKYTYNGETFLSGTANDPEQGPLSYEWTLISGESSHVVIDNFDRLFTSVTGLNQDNEIYSFQLKAEDNVGNIATDIVEVHSRSMPTINAGVNSNLRLLEDGILLSATANDPYNLFDHYEWSLVSGPDRSPVINYINTLNPLISGFVLAGDYNFEIRAFDINGNVIASDTVVITVLSDPIPVPPPVVNAPPIVDAGDNIVTYNGTAQLQGLVGDEDSDILTYKWTVISGNTDSLTIDSPSSLFTIVSGMGHEIYGFQLEVSDGDGNIVTDTVEIDSRKRPIPRILMYKQDFIIRLGDNNRRLRASFQPNDHVARVEWSIITDAENGVSIDNPNILETFLRWNRLYPSPENGDIVFTLSLNAYDEYGAVISSIEDQYFIFSTDI